MIDLADFKQSKITLSILGRANHSRYGVARTQTEAANLARADINVVRTGKIRAVCRAQKTKSVLQRFQHTVAVDVLTRLRICLENREDDVLFALM